VSYQILAGMIDYTDSQKGTMICLCSAAWLSSNNIPFMGKALL